MQLITVLKDTMQSSSELQERKKKWSQSSLVNDPMQSPICYHMINQVEELLKNRRFHAFICPLCPHAYSETGITAESMTQRLHLSAVVTCSPRIYSFCKVRDSRKLTVHFYHMLIQVEGLPLEPTACSERGRGIPAESTI